MSGLRHRAASGVFWSAVERLCRQASIFVVQVILARLLDPSTFGLVAMVGVFVSVAGSLVDCGLGAALIQRANVTKRDLGTVWVFNLVIAVALAAGLWFLAPLIAGFYRQPALPWVLRGLGFSLIFNALGSVHSTMLMKEMQFRRLFWITVPAAVISGSIGVLAAYAGWREWALVTQVLAQTGLSSAALWLLSPWRFRPVFDRKIFAELYPFGSRLALSSIMDRVFTDAYTLVIGRVFTPADVGIFQRSYSLQQLPATNIQSVLNSVAFPLLSQLRDEPARLRRALRAAVQIGGLCSFPLFAVIAVSVRPMITVLLGEKWLMCAPLLQALCLAGALYPLHAINLNLLMALGRSDLFLRLEILKKILVAINIIIGIRYGIFVMAAGMSVTSFLALLVNTHYSGKFARYGLADQMTDMLPVAMLAGLVAVVMLAARHLVAGYGDATVLGVMVVSAAVTMLAAVRFLPQVLRAEIASALAHLPRPLRMFRACLGVVDPLES